jgi:hypothetical protein
LSLYRQVSREWAQIDVVKWISASGLESCVPDNRITVLATTWKIFQSSSLSEDPAKNPVGPAQGIDPATEECKIGTVHISMYKTRQNNRV